MATISLFFQYALYLISPYPATAVRPLPSGLIRKCAYHNTYHIPLVPL